jgi:hypothetical protein
MACPGCGEELRLDCPLCPINRRESDQPIEGETR